MRVWLLKSNRSGRTCGHLHVREFGAWHCRDGQPDRSGWSVVSTWLSEPEGVRQKPDWVSIGLLSGVLSAVLVTGLGGLAGGIWVAWYLAAAVVVAGTVGACVFGVWRFIADEYHDPPRSAAGWDWL